MAEIEGKVTVDNELEIPAVGRLETRVANLEKAVAILSDSLKKLDNRLQGVCETHHLWDGS